MKTKKRNLIISTGVGSALRVGIALGLITGCGDADTFKIDPGDIDPSTVPTDHACFVGSVIELARYSSACGRTSASLTSEVQTGIVFSAEEVRTLLPPCGDGPTPGFEVIFNEESHSMLLDFSRIARAGRFPEADFEGYSFDLTLEEANGLLLGVTVDRGATSLDVDDRDLAWDPDHIEVNVEGVAFDDQSLLKLDLHFARVSPVAS